MMPDILTEDSISMKPLLNLTAALALLLPSCTLGPDHQTPALPGDLAKLQVNDVTQPMSLTSCNEWWKSANDPDLDQLIAQALDSNLDLKLAIARLDEARAIREQGKSHYLPSGGFTGGVRQQLDSTVFFQGVPRSIRDQTVFDGGFEATWELDLFGKVKRTVEAGDALAQASAEDLRDVRRMLAASVSSAYVEHRTSERLLEIRLKQLASLETLVESARKRMEAGDLTRGDLAEIRSRQAEMRSNIRTLRLGQREAANRIAVLTGKGVAPSLPESGTIPTFRAPEIPRQPLALILGRPDVRAAERRLAAATANIGIAMSELYPSVTLQGRLALEANTLSALGSADSEAFSFGPRLRWDFLNLQRNRAKVKASEASSTAALAQWENQVLLVLEEVDNAISQTEEARAALVEARDVLDHQRLRAEEIRRGDEEMLLSPEDREPGLIAQWESECAKLHAEAALAKATIHLQQSVTAP